MPIKFPSNNRVLNNNARAVDVAKDTIERVKDVQARRYQEAFRVQGFQCILYHPLTSGQRCACVGKRQIVAALLDEKGNAKPGFINELLTGERFDIAPYGTLHSQPVIEPSAQLPEPGKATPTTQPGWVPPGPPTSNAGMRSVELLVTDDDGNLVYRNSSPTNQHAPAHSPNATNPNYQTPNPNSGNAGVQGHGTVQPMAYSDDFPGANGNAGALASGQAGVADEESAFGWAQRNLDHEGCSDRYGVDSQNSGNAQHKHDDLLSLMTTYSDVYSTTHADPQARTIVPKELGSTDSGGVQATADQPEHQPPNSTIPDPSVMPGSDPDDENDLPQVPHEDYTGDPFGTALPTVGVPVGDLGAVPNPLGDPNKPGVIGSQLPTVADYPMPVQSGTTSVLGQRPHPIVSHSDADTFEQLTGTYDNPDADAQIAALENALLSEAGQREQQAAEVGGMINDSLMSMGGDALAALSDAKCPVCFGTGFVGGYRVYNGWRNVQSPATNPNWLGDSEVNWQAEIPYVENCSGIEFRTILPVNCVGVDAMNVRNGKNVLPATFYVDDKRLNTEQDLARFCDGKWHTIRCVLRRVTTVTHVEIQVNQSREWVLFEFPRVTRTSNVELIDNTGPISVNAPPMIADIRPKCVFVESTYGKPFLVLDVPTWNDRKRSILGWDFEARVIQPTELASYLPKRLQLESQNRLVQVRDNMGGFSRRT